MTEVQHGTQLTDLSTNPKGSGVGFRAPTYGDLYRVLGIDEGVDDVIASFLRGDNVLEGRQWFPLGEEVPSFLIGLMISIAQGCDIDNANNYNLIYSVDRLEKINPAWRRLKTTSRMYTQGAAGQFMPVVLFGIPNSPYIVQEFTMCPFRDRETMEVSGFMFDFLCPVHFVYTKAIVDRLRANTFDAVDYHIEGGASEPEHLYRRDGVFTRRVWCYKFDEANGLLHPHAFDYRAEKETNDGFTFVKRSLHYTPSKFSTFKSVLRPLPPPKPEPEEPEEPGETEESESEEEEKTEEKEEEEKVSRFGRACRYLDRLWTQFSSVCRAVGGLLGSWFGW